MESIIRAQELREAKERSQILAKFRRETEALEEVEKRERGVGIVENGMERRDKHKTCNLDLCDPDQVGIGDVCDFCGETGHWESDCDLYAHYRACARNTRAVSQDTTPTQLNSSSFITPRKRVCFNEARTHKS